MSILDCPDFCMGCIEKDAEVEIVLDDGQCLSACKNCVALVIQENASTENPVHSIEELEVNK